MHITVRPSLAFIRFVGVGALFLLMTTRAWASTGSLVTGGGHGFLANRDQIDISLTAKTLPGSATQGHFSITHHTAGGGLFAHLEGSIDCLTVAANHAVVQ